jgi:hypothetical protein
VATPIFNSNFGLVLGTAVELKQFSFVGASLLHDSRSFMFFAAKFYFPDACREADLRAERLATGATKNLHPTSFASGLERSDNNEDLRNLRYSFFAAASNSATAAAT